MLLLLLLLLLLPAPIMAAGGWRGPCHITLTTLQLNTPMQAGGCLAAQHGRSGGQAATVRGES